MNKKEISLIEEKINLAHCEVLESKSYIEISLLTLLFMFLAFFTEESFITFLANHNLIAFIVISSIILTFFTIVYLFWYILSLKRKSVSLFSDKKNLNRDWSE